LIQEKPDNCFLLTFAKGSSKTRVSLNFVVNRIGILNLGSGISVLVKVDFITGTGATENITSKKDVIGKGMAKILKKYNDLV
jgi:hypothetical protein